MSALYKVLPIICIIPLLHTITYVQADTQILNVDQLTGRTLADDDLRELFEFLRLQMSCGFPAANIPPLAPFNIPYKELKYQADKLDFSGNISDFTLTGLDGFDIVYLHWNHFHQKLEFTLNYATLKLNTGIKFDAYWELLSVLSQTSMDGSLALELNELRLVASITFGITRERTLRAKYFDMQMQLGNVKANILGLKTAAKTKFMNAWLEEFITILFESEEEMSTFLSNLFMPALNNMLSHIPPWVLAGLMMGLVHDVLPNEPICAQIQ